MEESEVRIQVFWVPVLSFSDQIMQLCAENCKPIASVLIMSLLSKPEVSLVPTRHLVSLFLDLDYSNIAVTLSRYKAFLEFMSVDNNIQIVYCTA